MRASRRLNKQLDTVDEQAKEAEEQREKQEKLQDEQEALADVRAKPVKVKDVAKVQEVLAPTTVTQIEGTPSVTITATPEASDLGALTATIQSKLDSITDLPPGVTATLGGAAENQREAFTQLGLAMLVAIALVFMIMVGTFRSLVQPLILMVSIPFAATGAVAGLLITDTPLGVPAMVGLLMLIGIVVTNAIVLIDLINQYRGRGEDLHSAIIDGARLRLRPIIMTACATIFALIPMASRTDRRRRLHLRTAGDCRDWRPGLLDGAHSASGASALLAGRAAQRTSPAARSAPTSQSRADACLIGERSLRSPNIPVSGLTGVT